MTWQDYRERVFCQEISGRSGGPGVACPLGELPVAYARAVWNRRQGLCHFNFKIAPAGHFERYRFWIKVDGGAGKIGFKLRRQIAGGSRMLHATCPVCLHTAPLPVGKPVRKQDAVPPLKQSPPEPGFICRQQALLAALCSCHCRKLPARSALAATMRALPQFVDISINISCNLCRQSLYRLELIPAG